MFQHPSPRYLVVENHTQGMHHAGPFILLDFDGITLRIEKTLVHTHNTA